ncbi:MULTISPECIES: NAD(P)/FAD-dependent oxidoreductase [unclassified Arthrobacter]|uniref:dihydrolipoyl dehydrogenase family protein n=1 Tax=unclassified Arthrobacter TaxID=235627 RepID=UPI001E5F153B|nr:MULTISPECIES: NAD(P)/FAD-dependent oxidoreductase [unclassified Arthrobacter]MCC9146724.1 NAD(P)/FAD-dependent oxidoreductase [Arthrobacter sp. zg-Y919]MDK1277955.1 NAD(P)/FAD-dependent oxidoreductase [Arthrobacter sp. zg.Y919]WIB03452.1 NAD(P)/FAD-dependent oxidoreductase [Arthrobacter sp. zg-Y919]
MTETLQTDVVVIGAGAVGENAADRVVRGGLSAVLVEAALVGGECSYWACMPSKALLRPGTVLKEAQSLAGSREAVTGRLDTSAVLERRTSFTSNWDDAGQAEWVAGAGIELVRGRARLTGEREVEVATTDGRSVHISARHTVVLATGSTPSTPPIDGLDTVDYWGTRDATSATEIPGRLVVIGGGVSGVELSQAYARLGAKVTLLARGSILKSFPEPARALVEEGLKESGVDVRTSASPSSVRKSDDGGVEVGLDGGGTVAGDRLLVSTGRRPALDGLGLEGLGLDPHRLDIDDTGRVAGAGGWLYAVGDAAGKVLLTHQGKYEARATGDAIAARARQEPGSADPAAWSRYTATADHSAVPQVVFTDPELAMVGRTLEQARADGINASETSLEIAVAGSSLYADNYRGWAQMVVDEDRRTLVGMTFAGPGVSELLHAATIAVTGEIPLDRLWHAVPAYPTISEVWLRLLEKYGL